MKKYKVCFVMDNIYNVVVIDENEYESYEILERELK